MTCKYAKDQRSSSQLGVRSVRVCVGLEESRSRSVGCLRTWLLNQVICPCWSCFGPKPNLKACLTSPLTYFSSSEAVRKVLFSLLWISSISFVIVSLLSEKIVIVLEGMMWSIQEMRHWCWWGGGSQWILSIFEDNSSQLFWQSLRSQEEVAMIGSVRICYWALAIERHHTNKTATASKSTFMSCSIEQIQPESLSTGDSLVFL